MTCGWELQHQPWRTPWNVARRRVCSTDEVPIDRRGTHLWRARHVAIIGVVTSENSVEPFPLQALVPSGKLGSASGDDCAFLRFAGRSGIQLHGADRDSAKA